MVVFASSSLALPPSQARSWTLLGLPLDVRYSTGRGKRKGREGKGGGRGKGGRGREGKGGDRERGEGRRGRGREGRGKREGGEGGEGRGMPEGLGTRLSI